MDYRILGKTGLKVSRLGLGGIPIQRVDAAATKELLGTLAKAGVNYIDTARGYTVSEQYIGQALAELGLREQFILATKTMARSYTAMKADIETSLKNLRTDRIELYQLHNVKLGDIDTVFGPEGAVRAIREAMDEGKIGHMGVTCHNADSLLKLLDYPQVETAMFPLNIVENQGRQALDKCHQNNVGFVAMKPLAGGNLEDIGLALRYLAAEPYCDLIIPGMATLEEAAQNLAAMADTSPLTPEEEAHCQALRDQLGNDFCRRCGYCGPCAVGIDIPSCFTFANYVARYSLSDWAHSRYDTMPVKAGDCVGCGVCEVRCPYDLPIRRKLREVKELMGG